MESALVASLVEFESHPVLALKKTRKIKIQDVIENVDESETFFFFFS